MQEVSGSIPLGSTNPPFTSERQAVPVTDASDLHLVLTFDDAFWAPAYATMRSVCLTTARKTDLVFHLLHLPLSDEHRRDLEAITSEFGARLVFHDLSKGDILGERIALLPPVRASRLHNVVYARLFLPEFLPSTAKRAIYLDCDVMVRSPIERLMDIDLGDCVLAAVQQPDRLRQLSGYDLRERHILPMTEPYFNAGVLLFDLERYRAVDVVGELSRMLPPADIAALYYDQDILNVVFRGRILELDPRWNLQNPETAHEAFDPHILHYSGSKKPWSLRPDVAFAATYRHAMTNALFYRYFRFRLRRRLTSR
jgi:lipopolysaccharide biosynthesis glycosyltransferase